MQFGISYTNDKELKKFARETIPDDPHLPELRQVNTFCTYFITHLSFLVFDEILFAALILYISLYTNSMANSLVIAIFLWFTISIISFVLDSSVSPVSHEEGADLIPLARCM